jgi:hypothetical protein
VAMRLICRRVLSSALFKLIATRPVVAPGNEPYKLNLEDNNYK